MPDDDLDDEERGDIGTSRDAAFNEKLREASVASEKSSTRAAPPYASAPPSYSSVVSARSTPPAPVQHSADEDAGSDLGARSVTSDAHDDASSPSTYYDRTPSLSRGSASVSSRTAISNSSRSSSAESSGDDEEASAHIARHPDTDIFERYAHLFDRDNLPQGTVGACAIDASGRLAVATSTGGKTNKNAGRIGDTPSVGAGFWAERFVLEPSAKASLASGNTTGTRCSWSDLFCCLAPRRQLQNDEEVEDAAEESRGLALSGTGDGDYFLRTAFASLVSHRMRFLGEEASVAGRKAIDELNKAGGVGGAIVLDAKGNVTFPMNSATMNRGFISSASPNPKVALFAGEELS